MDLVNSIGTIFENITEYLLPHGPFLGLMAILLIIGHRMSTRVFTKERAYRFYGRSWQGRWKWRLFYWGRETLPMHSILIGIVVGLLWHDPENRGWNRAASVAYFAAAGAASMMAWSVLKAWTKKKGIVLQLPGESEPPVRIVEAGPVEPEPEPEPEAEPDVLTAFRRGAWPDNAPEREPDPYIDLADPRADLDDVTVVHKPRGHLPPVSAKTRAEFLHPRGALKGDKPTTPKPGKR